MRPNGNLDFNDFIAKIPMERILTIAGYRFSPRDGRHRWETFRKDHGDKFILGKNKNTCWRPSENKSYNIISFIKTFPENFPQWRAGMSRIELVNKVCNDALGMDYDPYSLVSEQNKNRGQKPFDISNYKIQHFDKNNQNANGAFASFFSQRDISQETQRAFADNFFLVRKPFTDKDGNTREITNLAFPVHVPQSRDEGETAIAGFEERGRKNNEGKSYKGKAEGTNGTDASWIAIPSGRPLAEVNKVLWFESAYDAMSYFELHQKDNPELWNAAFVSTGGNSTISQMEHMIKAVPGGTHVACFDNDAAGTQFRYNLETCIKNFILADISGGFIRGKDRETVVKALEALPEEHEYDHYLSEDLLQAKRSLSLDLYCMALDQRQGKFRVAEARQEEIYKHGKKFQTALAEFLYKDISKIPIYHSEKPTFPYKDWNENLSAVKHLQDTRSSDVSASLDDDPFNKADLPFCLSDEVYTLNPNYLQGGQTFRGVDFLTAPHEEVMNSFKKEAEEDARFRDPKYCEWLLRRGLVGESYIKDGKKWGDRIITEDDGSVVVYSQEYDLLLKFSRWKTEDLINRLDFYFGEGYDHISRWQLVWFPEPAQALREKWQGEQGKKYLSSIPRGEKDLLKGDLSVLPPYGKRLVEEYNNAEKILQNTPKPSTLAEKWAKFLSPNAQTRHEEVADDLFYARKHLADYIKTLIQAVPLAANINASFYERLEIKEKFHSATWEEIKEKFCPAEQNVVSVAAEEARQLKR